MKIMQVGMAGINGTEISHQGESVQELIDNLSLTPRERFIMNVVGDQEETCAAVLDSEESVFLSIRRLRIQQAAEKVARRALIRQAAEKVARRLHPAWKFF